MQVGGGGQGLEMQVGGGSKTGNAGGRGGRLNLKKSSAGVIPTDSSHDSNV